MAVLLQLLLLWSLLPFRCCCCFVVVIAAAFAAGKFVLRPLFDKYELDLFTPFILWCSLI